MGRYRKILLDEMKDMKKIIILLIASMVISVGFLSGCNEQSSEESKFLGTWIDDTGEITIFHENGTTTSILGDLQGTGTWKLENDRLIVTFLGLILTFDYSFSNNDETLTLIDVDTGLTFVNIKQ